MEHLFLLARQVLRLDLLLNVGEAGLSHVHHIDVGVLGAKDQAIVRTKLFRQHYSHELERLHEMHSLLRHMHQTGRHELGNPLRRVAHLVIDPATLK